MTTHAMHQLSRLVALPPASTRLAGYISKYGTKSYAPNSVRTAVRLTCIPLHGLASQQRLPAQVILSSCHCQLSTPQPLVSSALKQE